jgi:hypothetical protein
MFQPFRALVVAVERLTLCIEGVFRVLEVLAETQRKQGPAEARLEELERGRSMWEVEMEALVAKAEGTYKAVNNAEARTRSMKKHYEKLADPFDIESPEGEGPVRESDALPSEAERLHALRLDVAPNHRQKALRLKFP